MNLCIQVSEQSDKSIFRVAILVRRRRMNTIHNPPCICLNTETVPVAKDLFAFNNDNCSHDRIASLRNFAARNRIHITKFHI